VPRRRKPAPAAEAGPPPSGPTRGELDIALMRSIVGFLGTWSVCEHACRRMRGCASPTCACFDLNLETIHAMLSEILAWQRLDGPRERWDADRPPVELFD
jgi:hypothetical protein